MALIGPGYLGPAPRGVAPRVTAPSPYITAGLGAGAGTTTATPPPGSSALNYTDLLKNDPILGQQLAGLNASGVSNQAALTAAQQRALIQYGSVPTTALPGVTGIDQTTRDLAAQNTSAGLSTLAKIQNAYKQADQASVASEAARGILRSGAYGQHAAENLLGYNQAQDTGTQTLLDYLGGLYNGYLQQQQTLQQQAAGDQSDALNRIIQQILAGTLSGGTQGGGGAPAASLLPPGLGPHTAPATTFQLPPGLRRPSAPTAPTIPTYGRAVPA